LKNILLAFLALVTAANTVPEASGQTKLVMKVIVASDVNGGNPVAVDLVLVTDETLLEELGKISASEWFKKRNQYRGAYLREIEVTSWEWVPAQAPKLEPITVKPGIVGGIIFADYSAPGQHRAVIDPLKSFVVSLGAESFTVRLEK
jgi:type VI secretion system protein